MSKFITVVPTRGVIFTEHQDALEAELADSGQYPQILRTSDVPLPDSRNLLIETALTVPGWSYLLMLDDDIVIPEGGLKAMLDLLSNGEGNKAAAIDYPHHLNDGSHLGVAVYERWKEGEPVKGKKLAWAGLGCVLIRREALEALRSPYFQNSAYRYARGEDGSLRMDGGSRNALTASSGEDVYFWFQLRRLGYKVAMVPDMVCGHCRIEKFVYRLAGGRYSSTHTVAKNDTIDRPEL